MKKILFAAVVTALALVACGGGSSGGAGTPVGIPPTPTPVTPIAYQSKIVFVGPLAGAQSGVQSVSMNQRGILAANPGAAPVPVMVISPNFSNGMVGNTGVTGLGGMVQAIASPMPSSSPSVAFSNTNAAAAFQTPQPGTSPIPVPAGVLAQQQIGSNPAFPNTQSAGTASAAIGAPVTQSPTTPVYTYQALALSCEPADEANWPGTASGWSWSGSAWVAESTPATSDIYFTGPPNECPSAFQDSNTFNTPVTFHCPYGCVTVDNDTPFSSLATSQWNGTMTSISEVALGTLAPDGSLLNGEIIFKTANGAIAKAFAFSTGSSGANMNIAVEVSGSSVDGF